MNMLFVVLLFVCTIFLYLFKVGSFNFQNDSLFLTFKPYMLSVRLPTGSLLLRLLCLADTAICIIIGETVETA
jgi:hypothetical protein